MIEITGRSQHSEEYYSHTIKSSPCPIYVHNPWTSLGTVPNAARTSLWVLPSHLVESNIITRCNISKASYCIELEWTKKFTQRLAASLDKDCNSVFLACHLQLISRHCITVDLTSAPQVWFSFWHVVHNNNQLTVSATMPPPLFYG